MLKRDYVDALGLDAASFAAQLGMDPGILGAMLAGEASIDVRTAVRIAHALGLPANEIMQMQLRSDFAAARDVAPSENLQLLRPPAAQTFPGRHLSGRLGCTLDGTGGIASPYFQEYVPRRIEGDAFAGLHAMRRGDRLRVFDPAGAQLWTGPILHDLAGKILLPYVSSAVWLGWFAAAHPADLALGAEHAAYLARAREA